MQIGQSRVSCGSHPKRRDVAQQLLGHNGPVENSTAIAMVKRARGPYYTLVSSVVRGRRFIDANLAPTRGIFQLARRRQRVSDTNYRRMFSAPFAGGLLAAGGALVVGAPLVGGGPKVSARPLATADLAAGSPVAGGATISAAPLGAAVAVGRFVGEDATVSAAPSAAAVVEAGSSIGGGATVSAAPSADAGYCS